MSYRPRVSRRNDNYANKFTYTLIVIIAIFGFSLLKTKYSYSELINKSDVLEHFPEKVSLIPKPQPKNIPILMYHYVEYITDENDTDRISMNIWPSVFEQQIIDLKKAGYTFITPREIPDILKEKGDKKYIVLSFDDGYRTFHTYVLPILKRQNVRAVNYILAGLIGRPNYLFDWQIREIAESGLVELGVHGYSHQTITSMSAEQARRELTLAKNILKENYGVSAVSYAYPYGHYNNQVIEVLKEMAFTNAVTIEKGMLIDPDKLFEIKRIRPGRSTGDWLLNLIKTPDAPSTPK